MATTSIPISPAPSQGGESLPHGLQHIARHNANSPYPEKYEDEGVHLQQHSGYSSPTPGYYDEAYIYRGQQPRYAYQQHHHQDSGLGILYVSVL